MDFNTLSAFVAVAETNSFSLAAEKLHLTQPAVSKRVAILEQQFATRLFDRIGRNTTLTEAGATLLPRVKQLLQELADIRRSVSNLAGTVGGILCMATSHHIGLRRLPPVLRQYSYEYPQVQLDIRFMDSESACTAVERGDLELAIVTLPPKPSDSLQVTEVWRDRLRFVVGKEHPLASADDPGLATLSNYPAVLVSKGTYTREIMESALRPKGLTIQIGMETNYLETLKMLASIGLGWSLLPETMTHDGDLVVLPVEELKLSRPLGLVTHRSRTLSNAAEAMAAICSR
jgi:DNA-binding transcriptional LysR family regulator